MDIKHKLKEKYVKKKIKMWLLSVKNLEKISLEKEVNPSIMLMIIMKILLLIIITIIISLRKTV